MDSRQCPRLTTNSWLFWELNAPVDEAARAAMPTVVCFIKKDSFLISSYFYIVNLYRYSFMYISVLRLFYFIFILYAFKVWKLQWLVCLCNPKVWKYILHLAYLLFSQNRWSSWESRRVRNIPFEPQARK